jgi:hypothetical protein
MIYAQAPLVFNLLAAWTTRIGGQPIEGRWVIVDREFKAAACNRPSMRKACSPGT